MTSLVPIALFGWIVIGAMLFSVMSGRRAAMVAFIGAWLFLPVGQIGVPGLPDLTKSSAASAAVLLGILIFDLPRVLAIRPSIWDLPMVVWCLSPIPSSLTNGLGLYDGLAAVLTQVFVWGIPYLAGRIYFTDLAALRELATGVLVGGLVYLPFCMYEIRFSPQLHHLVYGYHQHTFGQSIRWGGYRPMVFMQHGLMVAMWMVAATLSGFWLWRGGALRRCAGLPAGVVVGVMMVVSVLCKSTGALLLGGLGVAMLLLASRLRTAFIAVIVVVMPIGYMTVRTFELWSGDDAVGMIDSINHERAASLRTRLENESILVDKAMRQPWFGWGGWGRNRVYDENGDDITITDGLWVIVLGQKGLLGLASLTAVLLGPMVLVVRRIRAARWRDADAAGAVVLATIAVLYALDCLMNAMVNPVFLVACGAVTGALAGLGAARRRRPATVRRPRGVQHA